VSFLDYLNRIIKYKELKSNEEMKSEDQRETRDGENKKIKNFLFRFREIN
jgi:hypothetical protein